MDNKAVPQKRKPVSTSRIMAFVVTVPLLFTLLFALLFAALVLPRSWFVFDAPELGRTYVLTRDAVLIPRAKIVPELVWFERNVKTLSIQERYREELNTLKYMQRGNPVPLVPNEGTVMKGSELHINQMFVYNDFNGSSRYARASLNDLERGEYTVYLMWEDYGVLPILREVKD